MANTVDSHLSIPFFDSQEVSKDQESEEFRKILSDYLNWLPESIQHVIRTVLIVDSKLMGYKLDVGDIVSVLQQKNTLSEKLVQRLGEYFKVPKFTEVNIHIHNIRSRLVGASDGIITPLDAQEDTNLTGNGPIIIKASGGFNRFFIFPEDQCIYLNDNTLTIASPIDTNGYPIRNSFLSVEQRESKVREILASYDDISLFSDRKKK